MMRTPLRTRPGAERSHLDAGPSRGYPRDGMSVATKFHFEQAYGADPAAVWAMLSDPAFITAKCERTGSMETTGEVTPTDDGGTILTCTRVLPANLPSVAKPFVGDTLTVTEVQAWGPAAADGSRTATTNVDFGAPMSFSADMALTAAADGSSVTTDGEFKASVPFVGGKIEKVASDETTRYLEKEQQVGQEWLYD